MCRHPSWMRTHSVRVARHVLSAVNSSKQEKREMTEYVCFSGGEVGVDAFFDALTLSSPKADVFMCFV
jgi:hypothetical protein